MFLAHRNIKEKIEENLSYKTKSLFY